MSSRVEVLSKEVRDEIMSTNIYVEIQDQGSEQHRLKSDLQKSFELFRQFEKNYSRFIKDNELYRFNLFSGEAQVSLEFYRILEECKHYYRLTEGDFDPSILPLLLKEGYTKSIKGGGNEVYRVSARLKPPSFDDLNLLGQGRVYKPHGLMLDLGGIGKGFVVDKVFEYLKAHYKNYVVDAGGDIYFSGVDQKNGYDGWYSEILNPLDETKSLRTIKISNMAIATSGINKRRWVLEGKQKSHIINPKTKASVESDLLTVTVISESATKSDVMAKVLVVMGSQKALSYCTKYKLAVFMVKKDMSTVISSEMQKYLYD